MAHPVVPVDVGRLRAEPVRFNGRGHLARAQQQRDMIVESRMVLGPGIADVRRHGPGRGRPLLCADKVQHQIDVMDGQVAGNTAVGSRIQEPHQAGGLVQLVRAGRGDHRDAAEHTVGHQARSASVAG